MLPKNNRLKKKKDFERVFRLGKKIKGDCFYLKFLENNLNKIRVGFVVSKNVSNKATIRNKVKRRMREVVRRMLERLKPGYDVVIVAQRGIEKEDFLKIKKKIEEALKIIEK